MFRKLNSEIAATMTIYFDGKPIPACEGDTVATALLAAGQYQLRTTSKSGSPRGPYCMMGVCFECVVKIGDRTLQQACLVPVEDGMQIKSEKAIRDE